MQDNSHALGCIEIRIRRVCNVRTLASSEIRRRENPGEPRYPGGSVAIIHEREKKLLSHCVRCAIFPLIRGFSEIKGAPARVLLERLKPVNTLGATTTTRTRTLPSGFTTENEANSNSILSFSVAHQTSRYSRGQRDHKKA